MRCIICCYLACACPEKRNGRGMYVFSHAMRTHGTSEEGDDAMQAVASSALNQEQEGPKKESSPLPSA